MNVRIEDHGAISVYGEPLDFEKHLGASIGVDVAKRGSRTSVNSSFKTHGLTPEYVHFENFTDENGNPAGGYVSGTGLDILWQNGPIDRAAGEEANGALVEDVIEGCIRRLQFYQASKFACPENAAAIDGLNEGLEALLKRRHDRENRGVLGKHEL